MEAIAELPTKRTGFSDPEDARKAAFKSHEARRVNKLVQSQSPKAADVQPDKLPLRIDDYTLRRLTRVRRQLDRLDEMIQTEMDPNKLDRLASAQAKLAEQERQLAGRPLPGSLRPTAKQQRAIAPDLPQELE